MKQFISKMTPRFAMRVYHLSLARIGAWRYGNPSKKMYVFGVTGTNGKTTVANLIADVFQRNGQQAGCATTTNFRVGESERLNDTKQTMLGRMKLQKFLRELVRAHVKYAAIETSSEGIVQFRHRAIDYNAAVFTNLTPEHIESHGSFEQYRRAKEELFKKVAQDHPRDGVGIFNLDDEHVKHMLAYAIPRKFGFTATNAAFRGVKTLRISAIDAHDQGSRVEFEWKGKHYTMKLRLLGKVNVENAMHALLAGVSQGLRMQQCVAALEKRTTLPGRFEFIDEGQETQVLVDYAPEPASLKQLFEFIQMYKTKQGIGRIIHVTGSAGGGRDTSRRPILGEISAHNADMVIVTNEDPYNEDPQQIIDQVAAGARAAGKKDNESLFTILDRKKAITFAIDTANPNDMVVLTGKGSEQAIVVANNKKIPWDERDVAREAIRRKLRSQ
jgi:UDP-N-acetylmuramoyl-L-alanyl-D-glutamate--2,6-diaminopimelate ligase